MLLSGKGVACACRWTTTGLLALLAPLSPSFAGTLPATGEQDLTPAETVQWVVLRNAAVAAARVQADVSAQLLLAERALYVPAWFTQWRRESQNLPRSADEQAIFSPTQSVAMEQTNQLETGVRFKLPTGATLLVGHQSRKRESNLLPQLGKEYRGTLTFSFKQPLLKNAGRAATEADLHVLELEHQIELLRMRKQLLESAGEGVNAYWQLYRAVEGEGTRQRSAATLRRVADDVARRVEAGFAPRTELLDAEIALTSRLAELERAQRSTLEAQARLRNLLNLPGLSHAELRLKPAAVPQPQVEEDVALEVRVDKALQEWPGYAIARLRRDQELVRQRYARNQGRPDLNFELGYNLNGLAPTHRAAVNESINKEHPGWYVGIGLEVPLSGRRADARLAAQAGRLQQAELEVESVRNTLGTDVHTRWQQLLSATRESAQLRRDVEAREQLMQAERSQYDLGRSRLRQVLEREDDLNESRLRLLDSEMRLELARLALQVSDGSLLRLYGVEFQP